MLSFYTDGGGTQGFVHVKQAFTVPEPDPSPLAGSF